LYGLPSVIVKRFDSRDTLEVSSALPERHGRPSGGVLAVQAQREALQH
jgi:hypothetical protein